MEQIICKSFIIACLKHQLIDEDECFDNFKKFIHDDKINKIFNLIYWNHTDWWFFFLIIDSTCKK